MALWDNAACMDIDRFLDQLGLRHCAATLGSTLGDPPGHGHTDGSYHYREQDGGPRGSTGQARDLGTSCSECDAIARVLEPYARGPNRIIDELIWTRRLPRTGIYYSKGVAYTPKLLLAWQHRNHVHAAERVGYHLPILVPHPSTPTPKPRPAPGPKRSDPMYLVKADSPDPAVFSTNFVTKQWVESEAILPTFVIASENHMVQPIDPVALDSIPLVGQAPPNYQGQVA